MPLRRGGRRGGRRLGGLRRGRRFGRRGAAAKLVAPPLGRIRLSVRLAARRRRFGRRGAAEKLVAQRLGRIRMPVRLAARRRRPGLAIAPLGVAQFLDLPVQLVDLAIEPAGEFVVVFCHSASLAGAGGRSSPVPASRPATAPPDFTPSGPPGHHRPAHALAGRRFVDRGFRPAPATYSPIRGIAVNRLNRITGTRPYREPPTSDPPPFRGFRTGRSLPRRTP